MGIYLIHHTSHKLLESTLLNRSMRVSSMASKGLVVFAVLLAAAFLVATAEQTQAKKEETKAGVQGYHGGGSGGGGYHGGGGGGGGYPGHGGGGGGYPGHGGGGGGGGYPGHGGGGGGGGYPGHGGGGGGGGSGCRYQCCGHGHSGCRCCASPNEIPEPMYRAEVRN
ncbi:glycine-rich cell wall structural protein-like [Triticum urartu]|uniref:glycine-rich cell wall structural protein-like n=1 Tax=Triticum aestivum TaxID=4565 RepID=UPI001D013650|nr:glycine-rich cell wall structural protein-like [Triticum aestivum]XP_048559622.1 glycine-rich cell wall structural protein-like [Triticum urartu]XP_048559632.1 glycine-rich cell wall structural protein-like [Triticum urartu]